MLRCVLMLLAALPVFGQAPEFNFSPMASKAVETVEVNLDGKMLEMAARFLNSRDPEEAEVKNLLRNLRGVYVRSFKFAKPGEYSQQDFEAVRAHVKGKDWNKVVDVRSSRANGENAGVYINTDGTEIRGIMVIAAEPREFTVVNIVGNINPDQVRTLGGKFGIPKIDIPGAVKKGFVDGKKKDDEEEE